jgi:enterochelin esterase-like enzyme
MNVLAAVVLLAGLAQGPGVVSGRYAGSFDGTSESLLVVMDIRSGKVRGTAGPDERRQRPLERVAIDGGAITAQVGNIRVRLLIEDGRLVGEARRSETDDGRRFTLNRVGDITPAERARLLPVLPYEDDSGRSPRLVALREALIFEESDAVGTFWRSLERNGAPIIEPSTDADEFLVTFLWRGTATTENVLLMRGRFTVQHPPAWNLFSRVPGTDIWFKTLRLPRGTRLAYRLSENDPLGYSPPSTSPRRERYDPLNPRHLGEEEGLAQERWESILELPGAPEQAWLAKQAGVPTLATERYRLPSQVLGNERDIVVYTPPGYTSSGPRLPTVYLLDGEDPGGPVFSTTTIENLIAARRIPPSIVVRVANPSPAARAKELSCYPQFSRFLRSELIPFIAARYRVSSDPARTVLGGQSLGALAALCAGLAHAQTFGLLLVQSGAFWWEPSNKPGAEPNAIAREILNRPRVTNRIFLEAGRFEVDLLGRGGNILETTRYLRDVLLAKGYDVQYQEFVGDHDYINWRGTLADGLMALLGSERR